MQRYGIITEKNPREIVLLRGSGCKWKKCTFCDYHFDKSPNEEENFLLNKIQLQKVQGLFGRLEVINSGSFCDLDDKTMNFIADVCQARQIDKLHFECHYIHRKLVPPLKERFRDIGVNVIIKTGVETFDINYRENIMKKGFGQASPQQISEFADEVCLLFGLDGQTTESMRTDIKTGLLYFDRVCINLMTPNTTSVKPNNDVKMLFINQVMPCYINNNRVDILLENTDFGIGTENTEEDI